MCILLSDKYLKSPNCMHELFDVWRHCREDGCTFNDRTRVLVLPSAKFSKRSITRARFFFVSAASFCRGYAREAMVKIKPH